ncbi:MAG: hypothetical protein A2358_03745 [Candidatus Staskawiczbacteria bacterium RIFOXYB1_FULL_37_44]|uniref:Gram-positive cocci surface proteins LPxTG domain-containing protein n=1 Tax=Candidatus Staskawiczbacteria bacterium RIFOXYB1_FULL_37_44 TaxID=1802223 RepID=A0A1G2IWN3_9BACT|nr:MAG: hypothetical protein A2358_03745 [Candidatus Staskawiczbacteria bacterium RIFOXYB1_FULL_37_44]OGZ84133.1 MAG: hypothetical protein A2416_03560 [Candidatus Staskawiczbacteria bacterium RIFOXYC1_FULL_37_52]OGZ88726.1 MAG: hypothetical protein A2444_00935 [Candidatus Staskawiczbacteria bacterium RIFOXYC2_FULL_37_19]OGZ89005.1 MAG: hypothetical protein A2581_00235 [Candidatus Staskawiczbacteria bacterium RIFOXYD1_FULL_37_110]
MKLYKKFIAIIIFFILFSGASVFAVKHSSQFPKDPEPTIPVNPAYFPSFSNSANTNNATQNTPIPIQNENEASHPEQFAQNNSPSAKNNPSTKKSRAINLPWTVFSISVLLVAIWLGVLKYKKVI